MDEATDHVRLLPWADGDGRRCLLVSDGDGPVSRIADQVEAMQVLLAERLLRQARKAIGTPGVRSAVPGPLAPQLTQALSDALLIAECRGDRLDVRLHRAGGSVGAGREALPYGGGSEAFGLLTLPGHHRASARTARHHVRDAARAWGLASGVTDDLELITGELVANALEQVTVSTDLGTWTVGTAELPRYSAKEMGLDEGE